MDDQPVEAQERHAVRAIHSVLLKWFLSAFLLGLAMLAAGEMLADLASTPHVKHFASWCSRGGLAIGALSFALGVISWFTRETTKYPGFSEQRLPSRYRLIAWSVVAVVVLAFMAFVWYSLSLGFTSW